MKTNPNLEAIAGYDPQTSRLNNPSKRISKRQFALAKWAFPAAMIRLAPSGEVSIFRAKDTHTTFEIFRPHFSADSCANVFAVLRHRKLGAQYTRNLLAILGHEATPPAFQPGRWSAGTIPFAAAWALATATPPQMLKALEAVVKDNPLPEPTDPGEKNQ